MNMAVLLSKMKDSNVDGDISCGRLYAIYSKNISMMGFEIKSLNYELGVYDESSNTWYWYYNKKYKFFSKKDMVNIKHTIWSINRISGSENYFIK